MKKFNSIVAIVMIILLLTGCAGKSGTASTGDPSKEAPNLAAWMEDYIESLGEDAPAVEALDSETASMFYPGLENYSTKQCEIRIAAISAVAFEFALIEAETTEDAEAIGAILQERIHTQIEAGAFYPATVEAWEKAETVITGNIAALICANDHQDEAVTSFMELVG